jgi:hypothetical protein
MKIGSRASVLALFAITLAGCHKGLDGPPTYPFCPTGALPLDVAMFHGDSARSGWDPNEPALTPARVSSDAFGWLWDSDALDADPAPPRIHATPLYFDSVGNQPFIITATSNSWVYAIAACSSGTTRAGTIIWRARLTSPLTISALDGGLPLGVLATPVADLSAQPPRLYVTATDAQSGWQLFALDLRNGHLLPGWPLTLAAAALNASNFNGPALFENAAQTSQRGALALAPTGDLVYVPFATYSDSAPGWMVAVDTHNIAVVAAFSTARSTQRTANGGIWGAGGPAIDKDGGVWDTAGNAEAGPIPGTWGESLLAWSPDLTLAGTYTPFNHCQLDMADTDLGGSAPLILPDLDPATTTTPRLIAFGGKQGNVYLVDRDHLPGGHDHRPPCSSDSTSDGSLLAPGPQPQFGARGPLNVFGPYTEQYGNVDYAKMRTTLARFVDGAGNTLLYAAGASKAAADSMQSVPPSLARLRVVTGAGQPAYLELDATDHAFAFFNPGSPIITSDGHMAPIVWVIDQRAKRTASTFGNISRPVLYAVDGTTLKPLWQSEPTRLGLGAKYASPTAAHGWVFVATDRVQAFGLRR